MTVLTATLSDEQVHALATGHDDLDAVATLARSQLERRKLLLVAVATAVREHVTDRELLASFDVGWELLTSVERRSPGLLDAPGGVLWHPYLGAWAARCLRDLPRYHEGSVPTASIATAMGYLSALGAAASVRAGREAVIEATVTDGGVTVPSLGRAALDVPDGTRVALRVSRDSVTASRDGKAVACRWEAVRVLTRSPSPIRIEDVDPYRDSHQWPVSGRLDDEQAARWRRMFAAAWEIIARDHSTYLPGLTAGLVSITPLARPDDGNDVSAASRYAFGAIGTVLPDTAPALALLLIHEFQHVKLSALLDVVPLHDGSDTRRYYAPWRPDPRPLEALLQGAYAHIGVTDFWRQHRHLAYADAGFADARFARWREQTAMAIGEIAASPALTEAGRRFVAGMTATVAPWLSEPVSRRVALAAQRDAAEHRAAFQVQR
jgi:uncharacterized protein